MSSRDRRRWLHAGMVVLLGGALAAGVVPTAAAARDGIAGFSDQDVEWRQCQELPPLDPSEELDNGIAFDPWQGQWGFATAGWDVSKCQHP